MIRLPYVGAVPAGAHPRRPVWQRRSPTSSTGGLLRLRLRLLCECFRYDRHPGLIL